MMKRFERNAFNSEKINFDIKSDLVYQKRSFSRYLPLFKEAVEVLVFSVSTESNSLCWHAFQGVINDFVIWFWA